MAKIAGYAPCITTRRHWNLARPCRRRRGCEAVVCLFHVHRAEGLIDGAVSWLAGQCVLCGGLGDWSSCVLGRYSLFCLASSKQTGVLGVVGVFASLASLVSLVCFFRSWMCTGRLCTPRRCPEQQALDGHVLDAA
ncbi:hypothetical protein ACU8KH_06013 [Lachancea thermotolerans]